MNCPKCGCEEKLDYEKEFCEEYFEFECGSFGRTSWGTFHETIPCKLICQLRTENEELSKENERLDRDNKQKSLLIEKIYLDMGIAMKPPTVVFYVHTTEAKEPTR